MVDTEESSLEVHEGRNCLFCKWVREWDDFRKKEAYRLISPRRNKDYFAVLAGGAKVFGHTLLISMRPFDNLYHRIEGVDDSRIAILGALPIFCRAVKEGLRAETVYTMSMCDHWEPVELHGRPSTEHLHFHLLPRYYGKEKGERLFCLPDKKSEVDWEVDPINMQKARDKIRKELSNATP